MSKELGAALLAIKALVMAFRDVAKSKKQKDAIELGITIMEQDRGPGPHYNWRRRR